MIEKLKVCTTLSIKESLKLLDSGGCGILLCFSDNKFKGIITDGDIRRAILNNITLNTPIKEIVNTNYKFLEKKLSKKELIKYFKENKLRHLLIKNGDDVQELILEKDLLSSSTQISYQKNDTPIIIMAGGEGNRLKPFTHIFPKPLIPINNIPIIEHIINNFLEYGFSHFHISINQHNKSKMIKTYFDSIKDKPFTLKYIKEEKKLGTAGALSLYSPQKEKNIFITNCDILVKEDYNKLISFHNNNNNDITLVGCMKHYEIPYGVCEIQNGGELKAIKEKPEYDFLVNTGMYLISVEMLKLLSHDKHIDFTDLLSIAMQKNKKIKVFPINESSWIDIGQWAEYKKALAQLSL